VKIEWMLFDTILVISSLLPYFVILSIITGLLDGIIRFRKVTTPLLKKKIILGVLLLITSIAISFVTFSEQLLVIASPAYEILTLLTIVAVACCTGLGLIGGRLMDAKFPG